MDLVFLTYECKNSPNNSSIFSLSNGASSNDVLLYFSDNNLHLLIESYDYLRYDSDLNDGLKRTITITISNDINFYIDRLLVNTITDIYHPPSVERTINYIGYDNYNNPYYIGFIYEYRVHLNSLSSEEVLNIYKSLYKNYNIVLNPYDNVGVGMNDPLCKLDKNG
jgi:hypothetical protein